MKTSALLFVAAVLSTALLSGCADWPVEDDIEVGYNTSQPANTEQMKMAVIEPDVQSPGSQLIA